MYFTKLSLSLRVVDEQQIERHYCASFKNHFYVFEPKGLSLRTKPLPIANDSHYVVAFKNNLYVFERYSPSLRTKVLSSAFTQCT